MAKKTLDHLVYKNERAMSFEKFSATLQKAINDRERYGRPMHNEDVVDLIWMKVCNPDISTYVTTLKAMHQVTQRTYTDILQDIATQIPLIEPPSFRAALSEVRQGNSGVLANATKDGECPDQGAYTSDGKLFIGTYSKKQWQHPTVRTHHQQIYSARENLPPYQSNKSTKQYYNRDNSNSAQKRKAEELRTTIAELTAKKARILAEIRTNNNEDNTQRDSEPHTQAGNQFGGRAEKKKGKNI